VELHAEERAGARLGDEPSDHAVALGVSTAYECAK
jgi:hypothetical protein